MKLRFCVRRGLEIQSLTHPRRLARLLPPTAWGLNAFRPGRRGKNLRSARVLSRDSVDKSRKVALKHDLYFPQAAEKHRYLFNDMKVSGLDIHSSSVELSEEEMLNILRSELVTNETI